MDPKRPEVQALIAFILANLPKGWRVIEHGLVIDAAELRIALLDPKNVERWLMIEAKKLYRARNEDTYLRFAVEQFAKGFQNDMAGSGTGRVDGSPGVGSGDPAPVAHRAGSKVEPADAAGDDSAGPRCRPVAG